MHHGRLCYLRNSELILYFFYKNLVLTFPHLYFSFLNGFSAQLAYDEWYIQAYNLFFTSWPLVIKATFEQDVNYQMEGDKIKKLYPKLYYIGSKNTIFNWSSYLSINLLGLCHSLIVFLVPWYVFQESKVMNQEGVNSDFWGISFLSFTCLYTVVTVKLIVWTRWWTDVSFVFYSIFSILVYIGYVWFSNFWDGS